MLSVGDLLKSSLLESIFTSNFVHEIIKPWIGEALYVLYRAHSFVMNKKIMKLFLGILYALIFLQRVVAVNSFLRRSGIMFFFVDKFLYLQFHQVYEAFAEKQTHVIKFRALQILYWLFSFLWKISAQSEWICIKIMPISRIRWIQKYFSIKRRMRVVGVVFFLIAVA